MKIVSRFKDFYDFVAGYDTDPRKVFVRQFIQVQHGALDNNGEKINLSHEIFNYIKSVEIKIGEQYGYQKTLYFRGTVMFCDKIYPYFQDIENKIFYYDFNKIPEELIEEYPILKQHFFIEEQKNDWWERQNGKLTTPEAIQNRRLNTKFGFPIVFSRLKEGMFTETVINGNLSEIAFGQALTPSEAFTELYNWVPYNEPEMPNDPTDMQRFEGQGHDKKTSFRNIK